MQLIMKMRIYIVTIVEPTGVEVNIDIIIPNTAPNTERIAEYIITDLKLVILSSLTGLEILRGLL